MRKWKLREGNLELCIEDGMPQEKDKHRRLETRKCRQNKNISGFERSAASFQDFDRFYLSIIS